MENQTLEWRSAQRCAGARIGLRSPERARDRSRERECGGLEPGCHTWPGLWGGGRGAIPCLPLKNTTFQLFGGNMAYMSVKD